MKFKYVYSTLQRIQLTEIGKNNKLDSEEDVISFLISEYREKYNITI